MRIRKRVLIPLIGLALVLGVTGYTTPSYIECRRSDIESHRKLDDIDVVVIYGGHTTENAANGYKLADSHGSFVISNGNQRELEVARRARREYGFSEEKVIELEAETTLSAAIDVYEIARTRGFRTMANVSSDNHLITVETLNKRLPKDVSHTSHPTPNYTKFSKGFQTLECTTQDAALRMSNKLGGYDSWFGGAVVKVYNYLAPFGRKLFGGHPTTE